MFKILLLLSLSGFLLLSSCDNPFDTSVGGVASISATLSGSTIHISWSSAKKATRYDLFNAYSGPVSTGGNYLQNMNYNNMGSTSCTYYPDHGYTYSFKVHGENDSGEGAMSPASISIYYP